MTPRVSPASLSVVNCAQLLASVYSQNPRLALGYTHGLITLTRAALIRRKTVRSSAIWVGVDLGTHESQVVVSKSRASPSSTSTSSTRHTSPLNQTQVNR